MRPTVLKHAAASLTLALGMILLGSCSKDKSPTDPGTANVNPPAGEMETGSLYGRIMDEAGTSLSGASVSAGTRTATTDSNGIFVLADAKFPKGRAVILAKKSGFFDGARAEASGSGGVTQFRLKLMKKAFANSVGGADGGKVTVAEEGAATRSTRR